MTEHHIRFLQPSLKDLEGIAEYHLKRVGPESAERITDRLLETIEILSGQPEAGKIHPDSFLASYNYRTLVCGEYICIYRIIDDEVVIYRVVHGSLDYPQIFKDSY